MELDPWMGVPPLTAPMSAAALRRLGEGSLTIGRASLLVGGLVLAMWVAIYVHVGRRCLAAQRGLSFKRQPRDEEIGSTAEMGGLSQGSPCSPVLTDPPRFT